MTPSIIIINNLNLIPHGPAEAVEISWRGEKDVPGKEKVVGTYSTDDAGYLKPALTIIFPDIGYYYIRAESCSCSYEKLMYAGQPFQPVVSSVSGPAVCCAGSEQQYSISPVAYATAYDWKIPNDWHVLSGAGTTTIKVKVGAKGTGTVSVTAGTAGVMSVPATVSVTINDKPADTPVWTACPLLAGTNKTGIIYSIAAVPGATNYLWTVPTDWKITAGQDTNSVTVTTGTTTNVSISVKPYNTCGDGVTATAAVVVKDAPAIPDAITGANAPCQGVAGLVYSIAPVTGADLYTWTVPTGWKITAGQGTVSITVTAGTATGNIQVFASNAAGTSGTLNLPVVPKVCLEWQKATSLCEQDKPFSLLRDYSGFSSPQLLYYDSGGYMYVVDYDSTLGNIYKFDPTKDPSVTGVIYLGTIKGQDIYSAGYDRQNRRVFLAGRDTTGMVVVDCKTDAITTKDYGSNGGNFNRIGLFVLSTKVVCTHDKDHIMVLFDRTSLNQIGTSINVNTTTNKYNTYIIQSMHMYEVGGNIWVCAGIRANGNIGVYNSDFTSLLYEVNVNGKAQVTTDWGNDNYWQNHFYDAEKEVFYTGDMGAATVTIFNATTREEITQLVFTNLTKGKFWALIAFNLDPLTKDLYISYQGMTNVITDPRDERVYKINRDTFELEQVWANQSFLQLEQQGQGSAICWGNTPNTLRWEGGTAWSSDGHLLKYTH